MQLTRGKIAKYLSKDKQSRKINKYPNKQKNNKNSNSTNYTFKQKSIFNLKTKTVKNLKI